MNSLLAPIRGIEEQNVHTSFCWDLGEHARHQIPMTSKANWIPITLATVAAVGGYITTETFRVMLFPTASYSIPWGLVWHVVVSTAPHLVVQSIVGLVLAWQTYPNHSWFSWRCGALATIALVALFGWPLAFPEALPIQRIQFGVAYYMPMLIVLPMFLAASKAVQKIRSHDDTPPSL